ncbi:hypothetical protein JBE04_29165 [Streptomyces sp. PRKS01-29]|nr:hypothetical protein [Streptomyces sabulosicollis]MBI0298423.1 hypothetical protein [Streptomyces sabulosicollis]
MPAREEHRDEEEAVDVQAPRGQEQGHGPGVVVVLGREAAPESGAGDEVVEAVVAFD